VSSEAITMNAPRTQIVHDFDFIPACAPNVNDNGFPRLLWQGKGAGAESTRNGPWLRGSACLASLCQPRLDGARLSSGRVIQVRFPQHLKHQERY